MNSSNKLLSDITAFRTYSKYLSHLGRRESLEETINRNMLMHLEAFPKLSKDIVKAYQRVHDLQVMPSMRGLQFGGEAIIKNNIRQYNCSFIHMNDVRAFGEILFLLLSGTGVGYSVQKRHIDGLPKVSLPKEEGEFLVHDSIEGWAQALDVLMESYFFRRIRPKFNLSQIRQKGSYLVTTGARAPGPEPLRRMLSLVEEKLKSSVGKKLSDLEIHDINCIIADCVLAGGIRRAAMICLFDRDSTAMLTCKHGNWWEKNAHRARANNSAVLPRAEVKEEEYRHVYQMCIDSNAGEPGLFWTNDLDIGTNPCSEISLNSNQFCNLTTINQTGVKDKRDFMNRVYAAALIGTLQAAYTDFPYIRPIWKQTTEREALLGVSFTGIADANGLITNDWLKDAAKLVIEVNEKYAKKLGINPAARTTAIKPEGTASCVLGSSSGIHARHSDYYLRRIRMNKDDALSRYLSSVIPELVEDDTFSSSGVVVTIPQKSPEGAITRGQENAFDLLNRTFNYHDNWIKPGHKTGANTHNVSVTVSYKKEDVNQLGDLLWTNRNKYTGISLLPYDGGNYVQAPFEECDKDMYDSYMSLVTEVDLREVKEQEDNTTRVESLACTGGVCELNI